MNAKYLLPCSCGQKIAVEPRQAGQTISCTCGASLEVPSLVQVKRLDKAEPEPGEVRRDEAERRSWGAYEGLALLGVVILLLATGTGSWLFFIRPRLRTLPRANEIRESAKTLPPRMVWSNWRLMRDKGLDPRPIPQSPKYPIWRLRYRIWMGTIVVVGLLGLALTVTMLSLRSRAAKARLPSTVGETG